MLGRVELVPIAVDLEQQELSEGNCCHMCLGSIQGKKDNKNKKNKLK